MTRHCPQPVQSQIAALLASASMELHSPWLPHQQPVVALTKHHAPHDSIASHAHSRAQLVFADYGVMKLRTPNKYWTIGPREGIWVPPMVEHSLEIGDGPLLMRTIYLSTKRFSGPSRACALHMTEFLRQLILQFSACDMDYRSNDPTDHLARVLVDQLAHLDVVHMDLVTGEDDRLSGVTAAILEDPGDERSLAEWGRLVGASAKTLERLFRSETGLTFKLWRQRARVVRSVELLDAGHSVTTVAHRVGYSSASAYISSFRAVFGVTPRQYVANSMRAITRA